MDFGSSFENQPIIFELSPYTASVRNVTLSDVDALPSPILPIATAYGADELLVWHQHRRAQFLYAAVGTMIVETADGCWTIPRNRAVLIPPEIPHQVRMIEAVTNSLYIEPAAVSWWPRRCMAVTISSLLRELLLSASNIDPRLLLSDRDDALLALILCELTELAEAPLGIPMPADELLAQICHSYLADPTVAMSNADWVRRAGMSERTLMRQFRASTGLSPGAWRARARLLSAIPLLAHQSVADVAGRLGYATPAAFSYAFKQEVGVPPSRVQGVG